jgi:hypothetical protein
MRDHADNDPRTQLGTTQPGAPQRARSAAFEPDPGHRVPTPGPLAVNERPYRRISDPADLFRPLRRIAEPGVPGRDEEEPGYVIHLPVRVGDLEAATRLAYNVAGSLAFLRELDPGETTVSTADDQNNRHRVFCDLLLPDRSRCPQRVEHCGPCGFPDQAAEPGSLPRQWDCP